ncbi:MAG: DUF262 domain-containing protein [Proteobacteria bacterium]|uniref:DUF262 domain-containing protein n=1 Tax=Candidatus Avisuccinivibrio stercorigallinarum TaxID=2840704 RepID=A0A9D9DBH9_9GAMM|nr:DUF262 domain-containing protein [Candidatus Avisuccinivibrio stercorigallinarum]
MEITLKQQEQASIELGRVRSKLSYDLRNYAVDYLVDLFQRNIFYVPDERRRNYSWSAADKNLFIESVFLGIPIAQMFFADSKDGRSEIIDGAQRMLALEEFIAGDFRLSGLKLLPGLNGFTFWDISDFFRNKILHRGVQVVVFSDKTTLEQRKEIVSRLNAPGSDQSNAPELPADYSGQFMDFLQECCRVHLFKQLCPVSELMEQRSERLKLVLRFFAFLNHYQDLEGNVDEFLDGCVKNTVEFEPERMKKEFTAMLKFVEHYFRYGFARNRTAAFVPRTRFDALAVGAALALREKPRLLPLPVDDWLGSAEFLELTKTHACDTAARMRGRINFVRDKLLEQP